MSKKRQAPPKPEELIEKLDGKLESFKSEIVASLEERTSQLEQLKATQTEDREKIEIQFTEIRGLSLSLRVVFCMKVLKSFIACRIKPHMH